MAMPLIDDDNLPKGLQADLHRLLPSLPANLADHEPEMLNQAHLALTQQRGEHGRRTAWRWLAAGSAVAAMLVVAVTIFRSGDNPVATPSAPAIAAAKPTIIDAMVAARRPGTKQSDIDQIAMAAVSLGSPEVH